MKLIEINAVVAAEDQALTSQADFLYNPGAKPVRAFQERGNGAKHPVIQEPFTYQQLGNERECTILVWHARYSRYPVHHVLEAGPQLKDTGRLCLPAERLRQVHYEGTVVGTVPQAYVYQIGILKYVAHLCHLPAPLVGVVLVNANGINPQPPAVS